MSMNTKNYLDYSTAMAKFHTCMNFYCFDESFTIIDSFNLGVHDFVLWVSEQDRVIPWTVHRRLKQLRKIFENLSGCRRIQLM